MHRLRRRTVGGLSACGPARRGALGVDDELIWHQEPVLHRAVLVTAFTGWFDIAGGATAAVRHLTGTDSGLVASIDPDGFFDFTVRRPTVSLDDDDRRVVSWPRNEVRVGGGGVRPAVRSEGGPHDLVLLAGEEPNLRWGTFAGLVVEAVRRLRCEMVVTVGTVADTQPHTRVPLVFGSSTNEQLAARLGLSRPRYQGPTGVVGVLHDRLDRAGIPAISLRAPVPHYLAGTPNPKATVALLQHLEHVLGVPTGHGMLADEVALWAVRHQEAVEADSDAPAYVRQLEAVHDQRLDAALAEGDLAGELEAFLREQRGEL